MEEGYFANADVTALIAPDVNVCEWGEERGPAGYSDQAAKIVWRRCGMWVRVEFGGNYVLVGLR